jgi:hypothetical protein
VTGGAAAALIACTLVIAMPAWSAEPFEGRWAADAQACTDEGAVTSPLLVGPLTLTWCDGACVVRTSYRVRDSWHIGARCWGEGAISNVPITLRMRGAQLVLDWARAPAEALRRCP